MKYFHCDVLVIGGGETGIRAAVEARRQGADKVLLLTKGVFGAAGVMFSPLANGWDMQAATGENDPEDSPEIHYQDILNAARGVCDPRLAKILTLEAAERVQDLERLFGLSLVPGESGKPRQVYGCFSSKNRAYQAAEPKVIKEKMAKSIGTFGITLMENHMAVRLLVKENQCCGAVCLSRSGEYSILYAGAVVLGAGGATGIFQHNFASGGMCGDGYLLALEAGCTLANMEFMQFGWGILAPKYKFLFLDRLLYLSPKFEFQMEHRFSWPLEEILSDHAKHFPFSCCDKSYQADIAVFKETLGNGGRGVSVDISNIPLAKLEEIPVWHSWCQWFGEENNPYEHKMRITPFAHACNGGVVIDENAMTQVCGLFAAGEMAAGPHGADRLGGNMHTACQVFGARAGAGAARWARENPQKPGKELSWEALKTGGEKYKISEMKEELGKLMWENANVARNDQSLAAALNKVTELKNALPDCCLKEQRWDYYECKSSLAVAEAILNGAFLRTESRGSHYREDYPETEKKPYLLRTTLEGARIKTVKGPVFGE